MALTIAQLFPAQSVPTSLAVIFTVPSNPSTYVLKNGRMRFTNVAGSLALITAHTAPSATPSAASNAFIWSQILPANTSMEVDIPTMRAGDTLRVVCDTSNAVTVHEMGGVLHYT